MNTLVSLIAMVASLFFGFMTAYSNDFIISAYSAICFIGLGALSVALCFQRD